MYSAQKCRSADFEALQLYNVWSGRAGKHKAAWKAAFDNFLKSSCLISCFEGLYDIYFPSDACWKAS